jgi:hypothetical protein
MFTALSHDFVLRRNIRVASAGRYHQPSSFVRSIFESHHVRLANFTAHLWNSILKKWPSQNLQPLPTFSIIQTGEAFGVINSTYAATYGGLFEPKKEEDEFIDLSNIDNMLEDIGMELAGPPSHENSEVGHGRNVVELACLDRECTSPENPIATTKIAEELPRTSEKRRAESVLNTTQSKKGRRELSPPHSKVRSYVTLMTCLAITT